MPEASTWYVYVLQSQQTRRGKGGKALPGFFYVGCTTDVARRLRQHNGEIVGGAKYTAQHRPWCLMAVYGTYSGRSDAQKAERALKRGKRGAGRIAWTPADSKWCRGLGTQDPLVTSGQGLPALPHPEEGRPAPESKESPPRS